MTLTVNPMTVQRHEKKPDGTRAFVDDHFCEITIGFGGAGNAVEVKERVSHERLDALIRQLEGCKAVLDERRAANQKEVA